ncbi:hypothetical protein I4U23_002445 [Adineta vaga]|nr:hypothetical protein I4U23_002445 [Adineta vaga]
MILSDFILYLSILFISYPKYIYAIQCHVCITKVFDHHIDSNNLPFPTEEDCHIVQAHFGCYIHIDWFDDGTSAINYNIDPPVPFNSITTVIERRMTINTGEYATRKSIRYGCKSNRTACNSIDHIKRAMNSVTFPSLEKIKQFDSLLISTKHFTASSCLQTSNMKNCSQTNLTNCQQCVSMIRYSDRMNVCSSCTSNIVKRNYFIYRTIFHINMVTRVEEITIGCQNGEPCNKRKNIDQIKQDLKITLNLLKFYRSIASAMKSTCLLLFTIGFLRIL